MWQSLAWFLTGGAVAGAVIGIGLRLRSSRGNWIATELQQFFCVKDAAGMEVRARSFPQHVAPDAKCGLDEWLSESDVVSRVIGVPVTNTFMHELSIGSLMAPRGEEWYQGSSIEYQSFDVGDDRCVECARHALWLVEDRGRKLALLWTSTVTPGGGGFVTTLRLEIGYLIGGGAATIADDVLRRLELAVKAGRTYRGKILSLEKQEDYAANSAGITIHRLRKVARDDVILPESTVTLLERNLVRFVEQRPTLVRLGMPTKKGLLFYGPPGTGKTHTIQYLIGALEGHTTILITAEQIGAFADYMTLARLLQPSLVIIEDVDLIAKHRDESSPCEQSLLNRLLNEMDGFREDAAILFILTTNRPEAIESGLAARPGRVDQAVEFPLPNAMGREKLVRLYACGAKISSEVVSVAVQLTEGVSASFIKELMRRAIQFHLECRPGAANPEILRNDVDQAIEELLWSGGALNRTLLGACGAD